MSPDKGLTLELDKRSVHPWTLSTGELQGQEQTLNPYDTSSVKIGVLGLAGGGGARARGNMLCYPGLEE